MQAPPEERPSAELRDIDKLCQKRDQPPYQTGKAWGITYAAWVYHPTGNIKPKLKVYMMRDGDLIRGLQWNHHMRGYTKKSYHVIPLDNPVREKVREIYWQRVYSGDEITPLQRLQQKLRDKMEERALEQRVAARGRAAVRANRRSATLVVDEDGKPIRV